MPASYDIYSRKEMSESHKNKKLQKNVLTEHERTSGDSLEGSKACIQSEKRLRIDSDMHAWTMCLNQQDFEQKARKMIQEGKIPNNHSLKTICSRYNRKSNIVQLICQHICSYLNSSPDSILHIWPAYRYEKGHTGQSNDEIFFVLVTKTHVEPTTDYNTYQRCILDIAPHCKTENSEIKEQETMSKLPHKVAEDLKECLRSNATTLMKKHSNLNRVSLGWIKGSGYSHAVESRSLKESPCITLYVHIKGYVPLSEEPFVEHIENFDVDVREGVFDLCGEANEFHQNIKMGCRIDSGVGTTKGTVGPFVKYQLDSHMYYITSAHVVLDPKQMQILIDKEENVFGEFGHDTFQPPESESVVNNMRHPLGKTVLAVHREGTGTKAGVEVALVRIKDDRIPLDGTFPDSSTDHSTEFRDNKPFKFSTGEVIEKNMLSRSVAVYKFGCMSGLTKGICRLDGASSVRTSTFNDSSRGFSITLHGQIEIESVDSIPFAVPGDSGALVVTKKGETLVAVGILTGEMNDTYFVTPIQDILDVLSVLLSRNRKPPMNQESGMDFEESYCHMAIKVYYTEPSQNVDHQPDSSKAATEAAGAQQDIETNIAHYTDHKIDAIKTELTGLKVHIDTTKIEILHSINKGFEDLKMYLRK